MQSAKLSTASGPGCRDPRGKGEAVRDEVWEGAEAGQSSLPK